MGAMGADSDINRKNQRVEILTFAIFVKESVRVGILETITGKFTAIVFYHCGVLIHILRFFLIDTVHYDVVTVNIIIARTYFPVLIHGIDEL